MNHSQVLVQVSFTAEDPDRARIKMRRCLWHWYIKCIHNFNCSLNILEARRFGEVHCIDCFTHCNVSGAVKSWLKTNIAESSGDICPPFLSAMKSIIDKIHTQQIKPIHVLYQLFPFSRHSNILKQQLYPIYVLSVKFNDQLLSKDISFCFQTLFYSSYNIINLLWVESWNDCLTKPLGFGYSSTGTSIYQSN